MSSIDNLKPTAPTILRVTGESDLLRLNTSFIETLGLSEGDLQSRPFLEWIHPADRKDLKLLLTTKDGTTQARHKTRDGGWLEFDWQVRLHPKGYSVLGISHGSQDVSQRPRPPTLRYGSMAETLDSMARIVEARNPGLRCSIHLLDEEKQQIAISSAPSLPPEYSESVESVPVGPAAGSCATAAYWNIPVIVEDVRNDPLWVPLRTIADSAGIAACWAVPVTSTDSEVLGAMALYSRLPSSPSQNQIHGLKIAAHMVGIAIERFEFESNLRDAAKLEALGVLAGGVAHDFNNLLAIVLANAELAIESTKENFLVQRLLGDIVSASKTAAELCNQMLAYAGRGAVEVENTDCNQLIRDFGGLLHVALSKKARLIYDLADESLGILVDPVQFRQIIMNLITNASEALDDNEGLIAVRTDSRMIESGDPDLRRPDGQLKPGEYVRIRVSDNGIGMNATTRDRIFDPFFSTKTSSRGLGLAAVQGIVLKHQGSITLESIECVGTTFTLLFPRVDIMETREAASTDEANGRPAKGVLVVDDEPLVQLAIANILQHAGYTVLCANDGHEAIDVFRDHASDIDCIVLDFSMPKLNGIEALEEIRQIRSDIPVLLSSGYTEHEIMVRFRGEGLAGAIHKPASMQEILDKVGKAIGAARED